jgi:adhesin/invasin
MAMTRRWQLLAVLAVVAAAAVPSALSSASFTTESATSVTASTAALSTYVMAVASGNNQTAVVGAQIGQAPTVKVTDGSGHPVSGVTVMFSITSGNGAITPNTDVTDSNGLASVDSWTLGTTSGTNTLMAIGVGLAGTPVTFTATGIVGSPVNMTVKAGNSQIATVGTAVAASPSVLVTDAYNNPVPGATIAFAVASGGGSIPAGSVTTNALGIAAVGSWTLGTTAGSNTLTATATSFTAPPITFNATGKAGAASKIAVSAGNGQMATVGTAVPTAPSVLVTDAYNNPVGGVAVAFAVSGGGGSITGNAATTNSSGIAAVGSWSLGTTAGANALSASSGTLSGSPVSFAATGTAGAPANIAKNGGDGLSAHVGTPVGVAPSVKVTDAFNNPVSGVTITFAVASGGGSIANSSATTDASGIASVGTWTLGPNPGSNTLTATRSGLTGSPLTFNATGIVGSPTTIAMNGGNGQTATVGTAVITAPSVKVTDALGTPVQGVTVTFTPAAGSGSVSGGGSATTDASGIASVTWTLGTTAGTNTMTATSGTLSGSPVTFTALGKAGAGTKYVVTSNNYSPIAGSAVTITAQFADQYGNAVATPVGVSVSFTKTGSGGSVSPASATTNASGAATSSLSTANTVGSVYTVTATSASPSATGTTSAITTVVGQPASIAVNAGNTQTATVGTAVPTAPSVVVKDAYGNLVPNASVSFAATAGGGSVTGSPATTNASGIATVGSWTLGTTAGANTLTATCNGLTTSFSATGTAGAATKYVVTSSSYSPVAGTTVTLTAQLADQYGNPVATSGIAVTWSRTGTGGRWRTRGTTTNASGVVTATYTTSNTSGRAYTFTARSTNPSTRTGTTATVTTIAGAPATITVSAGNTQTARVGTSVATAPSVVVRDSHNNVCPGVTVTFSATAAGGSVTGSPATTSASGIATVGSWTLGTTAGANTLTATCNALTTSFSATGVAGPAAKYVVTSSSYNPVAGTAVTITAQLADQYGNAVATSNLAVTFTKSRTDGSLNPVTTTTNTSGRATTTLTTAGTVGASYTVTATSTGATGTSPTITTR